MGARSTDTVRRRTRVVLTVGHPSLGTGTSRAGAAHAETVLIRPIHGMGRAGSSAYLATLAIGAPLFLELDTEGIRVYHSTVLLGWIGGSVAAVADCLGSGGRVRCSLHSRRGEADGLLADVAIRL